MSPQIKKILNHSFNVLKPDWNIPYIANTRSYISKGITVKVETEAAEFINHLKEDLKPNQVFLSERISVFEEVLGDYLWAQNMRAPICSKLLQDLTTQLSHYYKEFLKEYPILVSKENYEFEVTTSIKDYHSVILIIKDKK